MVAQRQDPAERGSYLRFFYRNWRPTRLGRIWSRAYAWVAGLGILPELLINLQVASRSDGCLTSTVLVAVRHNGERYLVSMLGDGSDWVSNVRAASGRALIKRGGSVPVRLTEIPSDARAPILKAWCQVATSGHRHLPVSPDAPVADFAAIAQDYPVFRIDVPA